MRKCKSWWIIHSKRRFTRIFSSSGCHERRTLVSKLYNIATIYTQSESRSDCHCYDSSLLWFCNFISDEQKRNKGESLWRHALFLWFWFIQWREMSKALKNANSYTRSLQLRTSNLETDKNSTKLRNLRLNSALWIPVIKKVLSCRIWLRAREDVPRVSISMIGRVTSEHIAKGWIFTKLPQWSKSHQPLSLV